MLFLCMLRDADRRESGSITRADVEAFIEREQDRGIKITTIRTRLVCVWAFLRYLAEEKVV
jgi:site-specific recombinase XerD